MKTFASLIAAILWLCVSGAKGVRPTPVPRLTFTVADSGNVALLLNAPVRGDGLASKSLSPNGKEGVWLFLLPVELQLSQPFVSATDVRVAKLDGGKGYTVLVVSAPLDLPELNIQVERATQIAETPDGRAKLQFDFDYPFLPQAEREFGIGGGYVATFEMIIVLPRKYDDTDVTAAAGSFVRQSETTFNVQKATALTGSLSKAWISFPNPVTKGTERAKVIAGFLFGLFTLLFQVQPTRQRKIIWFVSVLAVSLAVIAVCAYFTWAISKKMEFMLFAAAVVPHAVFAAFVSLYLIIAKRSQAVVSGQVQINGAPGQFVEVRLLRTDVNPPKVVQETDMLKEGGRYLFNIWIRKGRRFKIVASYGSVVSGESVDYDLRQGQKQEVPVLNLVTPTIAPKPSGP